jgi:hypothetical protein
MPNSITDLPVNGGAPAAPDAADRAADFVARFEKVWADPDPQRLNSLVHSDVEFSQPIEHPIVGHAQAALFWQRLFTLVKEPRGEVLGWAAQGDLLYIEMAITGNLGGRPVRWTLVDHIELDGDRVRRRIAYFDPLPLIAATAGRPRAWRTWIHTVRQRRRAHG